MARSGQASEFESNNRLDGQSRKGGRELLHDLIFISQVKIFSSGRALQTTLRAAP
jgi:hypothetical protein